MPRYRVLTETSSYVVDEDEAWVVRTPGTGLDSQIPVSRLRRDREAIPLLEIIRMVIGEPMILFLAIRTDGVRTLRTTTPVRSVEALAP